MRDRIARLLLSAVAGTMIAAAVVTLNEVRLVDARTHAERTVRLAPSWYVAPKWPSDNQVSTDQTGAERVQAFARRQQLLTGIFALTQGRFIGRFRSYTPAGNAQYSYALADTGGATLAITEPTTMLILETKGDTLGFAEIAGRRVLYGHAVPRAPIAQPGRVGAR